MRSPTTPMEAELVDAFHTPIPGDRFRRRGTSPLGSSAPRTQSKYVQRQSVDADDDENITDHKISQRSKQIKYGYNTPGYRNMMRLIDSDPRLRNGGVLPLAPPCTSLKVSKRAWDVLARKWRRALHLFDDVYIHEEDKDVTTLEEVIEQQRLKWVSSRNQHSDRTERLALSSASIMAARGNPSIPMRLPLEESMKPILRNPEYFQDLHRVVPDHASSLTRGNTGVSPTDAGIKMFIAPSAEAALFNVLGARDDDSLNLHSPTNGPRLSGSRGRSPSPDMPITPSTIVQMRTVHSPMQRSDRSPSPPPAQPAAPEPAPLATAAAGSSRLSPLAAPYCPPVSVARSSPTDAIDATVRNYRPHHIQPQLSGLSIHHSLSSYNPHHSTAIRLENSFTSAVGDVSCGPALYAPPPPLVDRNAPATLYGATKQQPSMSS